MIERNVLTNPANRRGSEAVSLDRSRVHSQMQPQAQSWLLSLTSFGFMLLQSACLAVTTISALRLAIGIGSLAAASSGVHLLVAIHGEWLRIPMVLFATIGSLANLYVIWRIRSLRARPSSAWRITPPTPTQRRAETIQIAIALLTLVLVAVESVGHIHYHGSLFA